MTHDPHLSGKGPDLTWDYIRTLPRQPATRAVVRSAPNEPGIYVWFRDGEPVYLGKASRLRQRLSTHRRATTLPAKSTLRASIGETVTGVPRAALRTPGRFVPDEADAIDAWLDGCELTWMTAQDGHTALNLERELLGAHRPPLNRR